jgi:DNA-binding MarR family transcriptional regulator
MTRQPRTRAPAAAQPAAPATLADRLHSAAIRLLRRLRAVDREGALGPARLSALSVIVFAGPLTLGKLAEAEHVRPATISRMVRGLERMRLARRRPDPGDGRVVWIEATEAGRRLLDQGRRRRMAVLEARLAALTPGERELLDAAAGILARLGRDEG